MEPLLAMTNVEVNPPTAKNNRSYSNRETWKTSATFSPGSNFKLGMTLNTPQKKQDFGTWKEELSQWKKPRQFIYHMVMACLIFDSSVICMSSLAREMCHIEDHADKISIKNVHFNPTGHKKWEKCFQYHKENYWAYVSFFSG